MASPDAYQDYIGLVDAAAALPVLDETFEQVRTYVKTELLAYNLFCRIAGELAVANQTIKMGNHEKEVVTVVYEPVTVGERSVRLAEEYVATDYYLETRIGIKGFGGKTGVVPIVLTDDVETGTQLATYGRMAFDEITSYIRSGRIERGGYLSDLFRGDGAELQADQLAYAGTLHAVAQTLGIPAIEPDA